MAHSQNSLGVVDRVVHWAYAAVWTRRASAR
jgi:hypothetical protein